MINLLPYKEKKIIERIRFIRFVRIVVVGFASTFLIAGLLLFPTLFTINSRFAIATNQIKSLENEGAIVREVDISSLESRARLASLKLSNKIEVQPTEYIESVRLVAPKGISIDRFAVTKDKTLEVSGIAQSRETLQSFIKSLESKPEVSKVDSPVSNFIKSTNSLFILTITFK